MMMLVNKTETMVSKLKERYCCCNTTPLIYGIFIIGLHNLIHGTYGWVFIISSSYRNYNRAVNYTAVASQAYFIPAGLAAIWAGFYQSLKGVTFCIVAFVVLCIFNFVGTFWYFYNYCQFEANSMMDRNIFWRNDKDWVEYQQVPFTFWHLLSFANILATAVWIYYTVVLFKYRKAVQIDRRQRIR